MTARREPPARAAALPLRAPRALPTLAAALALLAACGGPSRRSDAVEPSSDGERLARLVDRGELREAHRLLTERLVAEHLDAARARIAAGEAQGGWADVAAALALAPHDPRALELRAAVSERLLGELLDRARALLAEENPQDAMLALDEALELDEQDVDLHFLRGACALRLGQTLGDVFFFHDAREEFLQAARSGRAPLAWFGAARAGYFVYFDTNDAADLATALDHARRGWLALDEAGEREALLDVSPERTLAEIAFASYRDAKGREAPAEVVARHFEEARTALEAELGERPSDPWAWRELSNLFLWEERTDEARDVLLRGLAVTPEDEGLHEGLSDVAQRAGGNAGRRDTCLAFTAAHPAVAIGFWHLGRAEFDLALEGFAEDPALLAGFRTAEAAFRRCRELRPDYAESCIGYELVCRSGAGWSHFVAEDWDAARAAWQSMEELKEGGLAWELSGRLGSGVLGLSQLIGHYYVVSTDEEASPRAREEALLKASNLAIYLHRFDPEDPRFANDAGFFSRDAAVALADRAEILLARSAGIGNVREAVDEQQRAAMDAEARRILPRAHELMETSLRAYARASELAPDDARTVNDTGLILTYYLQREPERARRLFRRAIAAGQARLAQGGFEDDAERAGVVEAVGDAQQNLGVLELTVLGDAAAARPWFEACLETGPGERIVVTDRYLPTCALVRSGALPVDLVVRAHYWADLDPERVLAKVRAQQDWLARLEG